MEIANNVVAKVYNKMQNAIDWSTASDWQQINAMENMVHYLRQQKGSIALYEFGYGMDGPSIRTVCEQIDYIEMRIRRFKRQLEQVS